MTARTSTSDPRPVVGLTLVAIGIATLANLLIDIQDKDLSDAVVFAALAAALLVSFVVTRGFGFLVSATAFAGLSAAKYAVAMGEDSGGSVLFGPGVGFLVAYALGAIVLGQRHTWALVLGTVLAILGGLLVFGDASGTLLAGKLWPILIIGLGVLVLLYARPRTSIPPG